MLFGGFQVATRSVLRFITLPLLAFMIRNLTNYQRSSPWNWKVAALRCCLFWMSLIWAVFGLVCPGIGKEAVPKIGRREAFDPSRAYHQITTHPDVDGYPAISPDGQWVAFASRRSRNMDIWLKPVAGGAAIQLTRHRADDLMPCWSPDGKKIVFVSHREDATGDLWQLRLKRYGSRFTVIGDPRKLTHYLGCDISPAFSPDGKYIAFCSDRDGLPNIYLYHIKSKAIFQVTKTGGKQPTWSPRGNRIAFVTIGDGSQHPNQICYAELDLTVQPPAVTAIVPVTSGRNDDAFPYWSPIHNEIFFNRYDHDTNQDGRITPDDHPSLWKVILQDSSARITPPLSGDRTDAAAPSALFAGGNEIQLMPAIYHDYYPVASRDSMLYFISHRSGNADIWQIPAEGVIPRQDDGFLQYQFALNFFPLPANDLIFRPGPEYVDPERNLYRLLAFQRVIDFFPNQTLWVASALYELGRTYMLMGQNNIAAAYFHEVVAHSPNAADLLGRAKLRLFELAFDSSHIDSQLKQLGMLETEFQAQDAIVAEIMLFRGEILFLAQKYSQALETFDALMTRFPDDAAKGALAQLLIGDIYTRFGQLDEIVRAYTKVIENYPMEHAWVDSALHRILALEKNVDFYSALSSYRNIIAHYGHHRRLAARAQLKIAELFFHRGDYEAAITELNILQKNYSDQRTELVLAELMLAEIADLKGEDISAIQRYKNVINDFRDVQSGLYVVQAKDRLLELYLRTAKQSQLQGEIWTANSRYRDAITLFPRHVDAHRGYVSTMYATGRIDQAIDYYQQLQLKHPGDEIITYILGLCYSYKATEISDRTKNIEHLDAKTMEKSNALILQALSQNYRLIQAYLTLSFNYEALEKHDSAMRAKQPNVFVRLLETITAPIRSVLSWITFYKEPSPAQYFERAIDALTIAIAINDEQQNPILEGELALNLANNYYNLGEFGFEQAYKYYGIKLRYDSTFANKRLAADVYKRIGHCALVVEDFKQGPIYLKRAIRLYQELMDQRNNRDRAQDYENWLLNIKRLALLYQSAGEYDQSAEYFKIAAEQDRQQRRYNQQAAAYRSIAYNYQMLNVEDEAIRYAQRALQLIAGGKVDEIKEHPQWIKIGILGIEIPVWKMGRIGVGASTAAQGFTTDEERALLYSILGQAALQQRSIPEAIDYLNKRIEIYKKRKDRIAEAIFLNNIGYLHYLDLNYQASWHYFDKSLTICKKQSHVPGMIINIINLATLSVITNKLSIQPSPSLVPLALPKLNDHPARFLDASLKHLMFALSLYQNEFIGLLHEQVQIYNALGTLHYLKHAVLDDSLSANPAAAIQKEMHRLEGLAIADSCFQAGLQIARLHNFKEEQVVLHYNLGQLALDVGDVIEALDHLKSARQLAFQHNLLSWLWRIDGALAQIHIHWGQTIHDWPDQSDAEFYLNEAINTLQQLPFVSAAFRVSPLQSQQIRWLYQTAIEYHIRKGNLAAGLQLTEQYRAKHYLDLIGSHRLELKKERHKIFLGNARFLSAEISRLDGKIKLAREQRTTPPTDLVTWTKQKMQLQTEYEELLKQIKAEDPELASFIQIEGVGLDQLQRILNANTLIIDYFFNRDHLCIWTITAEAIDFRSVQLSPDSISQHIHRYLRALSRGLAVAPTDSALWTMLILPIEPLFHQFQKIIIIPDGAIAELPLTYFVNSRQIERSATKIVVTAPALSSYYYCYEKRKIKNYELTTAENNLLELVKEAGYGVKSLVAKSATLPEMKNDLKDQMQNAELLYLNARLLPNPADPLISSLVISLPNHQRTIEIRELYSFDLRAALVILNGLDSTQSLAQSMISRAFFYAGAPTVIVSLWPIHQTKFWGYFFQLLLDYPAAEAFARAQQRMIQSGLDPSTYAGFQLIGYEGMNEQQELKYAEDRFVATVLSGNRDVENKKWDDAIASYEQALSMARRQGNQQAIENLYQYLIETAASAGRFDKAISYQLESLQSALANQDTARIAEAYAYLVMLYTENRDYENAVAYQKKYLDIVQQYKSKPQMAEAYRNLGLIYERGGKFDKALENYSSALMLYRELGDSVHVANVLKDRGRVYLMNLDNYSQAIENQQQALSIFQSIGDDAGALEVMQNIGYSHEQLANYETAQAFQKQALELAMRLGDSTKIALSKHLLANIYWKIGNYEPAFRLEKQAEQFFRTTNNLKLQSVALVTEGLILMSLGNLEDAIQKQQQALELARRINDRQDMANIHKNLGLIYRAQNRWLEAMDQFQQAIALDEAINSRRGLGYGYRDLGSIYLQQGITDQALAYFHKALKISQEILDGRNLAHCLYEIGRTHLFLENQTAALDTLSLAAQQAQALFIPEVEWRARRLIGQLYYENKNWDQSIEAYLDALKIIETMRSQIKVEEYKSGFIDDKLIVYYDLINIYLQIGQQDKALEIVERAKSRNFIDLLANREIQFSGQVRPELLNQGKQLENEIYRIQNELAGLLIKGENITRADEAHIALLNQRLQNLKKQYQDFLIELKSQNAELAQLVVVEPPDLNAIAKSLSNDVAILEYFYTETKFYAWAITNQRISSWQQSIANQRLIAAVDTLRTALQQQKSIVQISRHLYDLLIAPFEKELNQQTHLVIVPHGILHYLPFAALMDPQERYLIERYSLSLSPSASLLKICMDKGESFVSNPNWTPSILAFGNPNLNDPQLELPFAEKEIESVRLFYSNVISYFDQQATETAFKQRCHLPNIILLSCHGEFDAGNPLFSCLRLAPDATNDGRLTAHEIFQLQLNAYLVAMSACETGLATISAGDEIIGLSRSFIYAGSSSLLSSLWKVDDLATAVLIKRFFRYLKEGESRAKALQKAMELVRSQINVHPSYWAAFNLTGDFR